MRGRPPTRTERDRVLWAVLERRMAYERMDTTPLSIGHHHRIYQDAGDAKAKRVAAIDLAVAAIAAAELHSTET